jgi:hypothetical protein
VFKEEKLWIRLKLREPHQMLAKKKQTHWKRLNGTVKRYYIDSPDDIELQNLGCDRICTYNCKRCDEDIDFLVSRKSKEISFQRTANFWSWKWSSRGFRDSYWDFIPCSNHVLSGSNCTYGQWQPRTWHPAG